jgi:hypothetical protein
MEEKEEKEIEAGEDKQEIADPKPRGRTPQVLPLGLRV